MSLNLSELLGVSLKKIEDDYDHRDDDGDKNKLKIYREE